MDTPNQNKIVGREIAVARAHYCEIDDKGNQGYVFKNQMTTDPVVLEMYNITMEAMIDCVNQLEGMGSYEELAKKEGYDEGGYKPTGLVILSKVDPRMKCSVEFGHRWNKDSDKQDIQPHTEEKAVTLKWFLDVDNQDKEMGAGAVPERPVATDEMDIISKLRELTKEKKMESKKFIQPVLEAVKSHKAYLCEDKDALVKNRIKKEIERHGTASLYTVATACACGYDEVLKIAKQMVDQGDVTMDKLIEAAEKDPGDGPIDYEADIVAPSWQKWTARGGKPKYLGSITLHNDEDPDDEGRIQVYQASHADHGNLPGIHLHEPDQADLDDAIDTASRDGFGEIIIHGDVPPGLKLEGKEIKGAIMREKRTFGMDCEDVDFFGLPVLTEAKKEAKKTVAEAESTYSNKEKPAKAPLVSKDPAAYSKVADKLDGSGKMKDKDEKPPVMGVDKPLAKPASEVGKEYGEKDADKSKIKVGDPGDDHGDSMEGSGKSDMQTKALPTAKIKLGKPGDDSGKHMTDSKKFVKPALKEGLKGGAMLRRKMPEHMEQGMRGAKGQAKELQAMQSPDKKKAMLKANASEARKKMMK